MTSRFVTPLLTRFLLIPLVAFTLAAPTLTVGQSSASQKAPTLDELKERFKDRFLVLMKLKDTGVVGETLNGMVEALRKQDLDETVPKVKKPDGSDQKERPTLKEFLKQENQDRKLLYKLFAKKLKRSPDEIARQNALRNLKKAKPNHYFKLKNGKWVKKKALEGDLDW